MTRAALPIVLHASDTSNCRRVALVLEELQLPYEVRLVDRTRGAQHAARFRAINPSGMVPVIVDPHGPGGPITVTQSGAILLYLAEKSGRLLARAGPLRVRQLECLLQVLTDVNATSSALYHVRRAARDEGDPAVSALRGRLSTYVEDCARALGAARFLCGDLSIADFALYPVLAAQGPASCDGPQRASLRRWMDDLGALASVQRGMRAIADAARL